MGRGREKRRVIRREQIREEKECICEWMMSNPAPSKPALIISLVKLAAPHQYSTKWWR
jgi:hypothetical protein